MTYREKINIIYDRLIDEESRRIFDERINYLVTKNEDEYLEHICNPEDCWRSKILEDALKTQKADEIIIYGGGTYGLKSKRVIEMCGYRVSYFVDGDLKKQGMLVDGVQVIAPYELKNHSKSIVIISSKEYKGEMIDIAIQNGVTEDRMVIPILGYCLASRGQQYFDVFESEEDEVFVDAGAFDGSTTLEFIKWSKGQYRKVYMFEPLDDMHEYILNEVIKNHSRIELHNKATWNKQEDLIFSENSSASRVSAYGEKKVRAVDIDSVVKDDRVTFIKMDIEGAELKALEGAKETIIKNKPKLAICIYHKAADVIDIADYLLKIVPEYKFYIRHYGSNMGETVLYAKNR